MKKQRGDLPWKWGIKNDIDTPPIHCTIANYIITLKEPIKGQSKLQEAPIQRQTNPYRSQTR